MASGGMQPLRNTLTAHVKTLINQDLREICRQEGLPVSGIKNQLQSRIIDCKCISLDSFGGVLKRAKLTSYPQTVINYYAQRNDVESLQRLSYRIYNHGQSPTRDLGPSPSRAIGTQPLAGIGSFAPNMTSLAAPGAIQPMANGFSRPQPLGPSPARPAHSKNKRNARQRKQVSEMSTGLNFKPSPFFELQESVSRPLNLPSKRTLTSYLVNGANVTDSISNESKYPHTLCTAGLPPHRPPEE